MQIQRKDTVSSGSSVSVAIDLQDGQNLVSVELVETDSVGNHVYDVGLIALAFTGGAGIDLKAGHFGIGAILKWGGNIPVKQPVKLVATFAYPANGNVCSVRWATTQDGELGADIPITNVTQVYPVGKPKLVSVDGAANVTTLAFRPPANYQWLVSQMWALHDDSAARAIRWTLYDGTTTLLGDYSGDVAAGVNRYFSDGVTANLHNVSLGQPLLTYSVYAIAEVAALTATKKLYVRGLVYEFAGGL